MLPDDIVRLVRQLKAGNSDDRQSAERALSRLTAAEISIMLQWSRAEQTSHSVSSGCQGCFSVVLLLAGLGTILGSIVALAGGSSGAGLFIGTVGVPILTLGILMARAIRQRPLIVEEEALARVQDPLAALPMLQAVFRDSGSLRLHLVKNLRRLLPGLKASDSAALSRADRKALNLMLWTRQPEFDTGLVLAAMDALIQVGDASSLGPLKHLVEQGKHRGKSGRFGDAAEVCLAAIQERLNQERQAHTLLRASTAESEEKLLRPAAESPRVDSELLVRPAKGDAGVDST